MESNDASIISGGAKGRGALGVCEGRPQVPGSLLPDLEAMRPEVVSLIDHMMKVVAAANPKADIAGLVLHVVNALNEGPSPALDTAASFAPECNPPSAVKGGAGKYVVPQDAGSESVRSATAAREARLRDETSLNRAAYTAEEASLLVSHPGGFAAYSSGKRIAAGGNKGNVYAQARERVPDGYVFVYYVLPAEQRPLLRIRNPWTGGGTRAMRGSAA